ncbi:MAG: hypothetical protein ACD_3C00028G0005 [uncultured bacterium (gcode 4)]|uniref:CoA-binding domain-containing protein n=1 Tax=uncultured bacterium (gcode 4) TaxID=1234023 RepID=K2FCC5_9BACT|nr:MAG: hypothetical protein ACD_3C00028G0005 [uncultured bacterium (gcode 4)]
MKIAIIGASNNRGKFWNIILRDLLKKWHEVFPVNKNEEQIEWIVCYKTIANLPEWIEILNFVTPPEVTLEILKLANSNWMKNVWCQPWSSDEKVKSFLIENSFKYIIDSCIMINPEN